MTAYETPTRVAPGDRRPHPQEERVLDAVERPRRSIGAVALPNHDMQSFGIAPLAAGGTAARP